MAEEGQDSKALILILLGVISFSAGFLGFGILIVILSALGLIIR